MCDDFVPTKLMMRKQFPDSLRSLFQIWGHLYTGKLRQVYKPGGSIFAREFDYVSPKARAYSVLVKFEWLQENFESWGSVTIPGIDDTSYLIVFLSYWFCNHVFANACTFVLPTSL